MGNLMDRLARMLTGATAEERVDIQRRYVDQRADARLAALVADLEAHFDEDVAAERAMANLASLGDVPVDVLPDGPARTALVWLMSTGANVYAYASGGSATGTWVVWIDPLAAVHPGKDGRVTLAAWCAHYEALLAEMGLSLPVAETTEGRVSV